MVLARLAHLTRQLLLLQITLVQSAGELKIMAGSHHTNPPAFGSGCTFGGLLLLPCSTSYISTPPCHTSTTTVQHGTTHTIPMSRQSTSLFYATHHHTLVLHTHLLRLYLCLPIGAAAAKLHIIQLHTTPNISSMQQTRPTRFSLQARHSARGVNMSHTQHVKHHSF
jgi:hypothetical protein